MYTFGTLIALILLVEIGCTITILIFKDQVWEHLNDKLIDGLDNYDNPTNGSLTSMKEAWDSLQTEFKCCGVEEFTDWGEVDSFNKTGSVPDSCCKTVEEDCGNGQLINSNLHIIYTNGCLTKVENVIKDNVMIVGIIGAAVVVTQIIVICIACCLGKSMRSANKSYPS